MTGYKKGGHPILRARRDFETSENTHKAERLNTAILSL